MSELAKRIFNSIFDDEDLEKMESKGVIAQAFGYKASVMASIELELEAHSAASSEVTFFYSFQGFLRGKLVSTGHGSVTGEPNQVYKMAIEQAKSNSQAGEDIRLVSFNKVG